MSIETAPNLHQHPDLQDQLVPDFVSLEDILSSGTPASEESAQPAVLQPAEATTVTPGAEIPAVASDNVTPEAEVIGTKVSKPGMHRAERKDRLATRIAMSASDTLHKAADIAFDFSEAAASRRTLGDIANDKRESTKNQIEHSKAVTREVGSAIVNSFTAAGNTVESKYTGLKTTAGERVSAFKSFLRGKADMARERKSDLMSRLRERKEQAVNAMHSTKEMSKEKTLQAARVGKEVVKLSGLVVLGTGVLAAEAVGRTYNTGKNVVTKKAVEKVEKVKLIKNNAVDKVHMAHGDVINLRANHVEKKAERKHAKAYAKTQAAAIRMNRAHDLRLRADAARSRANS